MTKQRRERTLLQTELDAFEIVALVFIVLWTLGMVVGLERAIG
ncbi:MAG: hypothetical protein ABSA72_13255 [Nitrososphaerales archaeon]